MGQRRVTEPEEGRIFVHVDQAVSPSEISALEAAANRKVSEDAEFLEFEMERSEAEGHFGQGIYDMSIPEEGKSLVRVVRIPDWDACVCRMRHVESTAMIGAIRLEAGAFDGASKEQELRFKLL